MNSALLNNDYIYLKIMVVCFRTDYNKACCKQKLTAKKPRSSHALMFSTASTKFIKVYYMSDIGLGNYLITVLVTAHNWGLRYSTDVKALLYMFCMQNSILCLYETMNTAIYRPQELWSSLVISNTRKTNFSSSDIHMKHPNSTMLAENFPEWPWASKATIENTITPLTSFLSNKKDLITSKHTDKIIIFILRRTKPQYKNNSVHLLRLIQQIIGKIAACTVVSHDTILSGGWYQNHVLTSNLNF